MRGIVSYGNRPEKRGQLHTTGYKICHRGGSGGVHNKKLLWVSCSSLKIAEPRGTGLIMPFIVPGQADWEIKIDERVKRDNIVEYHLNYRPGMMSRHSEDFNGTIGILIMKFSSMDEMLDLMDNSEKWIDVVVE